MATQSTTIPRTTFPVGTTQQVKNLNGAAVSSFATSIDVSAVIQPCTVAVQLEYSEDAGATWHGASGVPPTGLPSVNDDGVTNAPIGCGETFNAVVHPNRVRWTVIVTGNPALLGPTTVSAS